MPRAAKTTPAPDDDDDEEDGEGEDANGLDGLNGASGAMLLSGAAPISAQVTTKRESTREPHKGVPPPPACCSNIDRDLHFMVFFSVTTF
jgi:hypothetical protein